MPYIRSFLKIGVFLIILFSAITLYNHGSPSLPRIDSVTLSRGASDNTTPRGASWKSWFHPLRVAENNKHKKPVKGWNLFEHLGGYGPWIEKVDEQGVLTDLAPPEGCSINQVHLMSRHAERYPTESAGNRHLEFLDRVKALGVPLNGSLAFLNHWTYFTDDPSRDFGQLTSTGPYAGTLTAFTSGVRFRTRYGNLISDKSTTRLWASDSQRVIDTAQYFASGLFGLNWESNGRAKLDIIPETFERGADTLTPGDTCKRYLEDVTHGHDYGAHMLARFQDIYIPSIARRLVKENPSLGKLGNVEVFSMQEMCAFETTVRGSSPWCNLFTEQEWESFEYARDLVHYYRAGPGNSYAGAMGWLWLNATSSILQAGPTAGTLFLSFVHDGDISPFLAALGILSNPIETNLPTTHIPSDRLWKTSSVLPMGARVTLERMSCSSGEDEQPYIRININDRIMPLASCRSGPTGSCTLAEFIDYVQGRGEAVGNFGEVCGLEGHAERITFLRQD
ncbi:uncharacterized protein N7469_000304 [Penicillium citrinum]|uniref:3-phytase n=1 Tax=Penicillium citrinum TaxID=5077 RepID=A0A9W9PDF2_PENCI|nr:uncharacterized protein N7469_000304 [Penicillium citrinum]KAJ5241977.1 hypothetical protein N7469_000304 [Penicillium citrinum]